MKNYTFSEYLRGRDSQFAGQPHIGEFDSSDDMSEGIFDFFTGGKSDMDKLKDLVASLKDVKLQKIMAKAIPQIQAQWEKESAGGPGGAARLARKGTQDSAGDFFDKAQQQAASKGKPAPAGRPAPSPSGRPAPAPAGRPAPAPSDSGRTGTPRANVVPGASTFAAPSPRTGGVMRKVEKTPPAPPRREIDLSSKSYIAK